MLRLLSLCHITTSDRAERHIDNSQNSDLSAMTSLTSLFAERNAHAQNATFLSRLLSSVGFRLDAVVVSGMYRRTLQPFTI
jgi:hypothetical protein